jgi:hypothetical protein
MSKRSVAFVAVLAIAAGGLAACVTATPYQPNVPGQASSGGYSEMRLEANRYRINFAGNSMTSRETVEGYLLFRAAELTVQEGYDSFSIVDRHTDKNTRTYVQPDPLYSPWYGPGYGFWRPSWRYYGRGYGWRSWDPFFGDPFFGDRVDIQTVQKFEASAEVVMSKGPKDPNNVRAFDARAVIANLQPRIQYPAAKK